MFTNMSRATKAWGGGTIFAAPGLETILRWLLANIDIGAMPPIQDVQDAMVQVGLAILGGVAVYIFPNLKPEEPAPLPIEENVER